MNRQFIIIGSFGRGSCAASFANTGNKGIKVSVAVKVFSNNEESRMWVGSMPGKDCENVLATVTKGREVVLNGWLSINYFSKEVDGEKVKVYKAGVRLMIFQRAELPK